MDVIGQLDAKIPDGPDRGQVGQPQVRHEARERRPTSGASTSSSSAPAWPARRPRPRSASSATRSSVVHLPRLAPAGALDRRPGRHQRGQELPERRRQRLPPLLRHVKGGDFRSREANVYRLAQVSVEHHRPVRRAGRAVRPRVRRPARQPLVRRRAGVAHVLRPRPDRPAAAARRLPGARCARSHARHGRAAHAHRDARPRRRRTAAPCGIVVRDLVTGEVRSHSAHAVVLATGGYGNVFYLSTNAKAVQRRPRSGGRTSGARCSPTPASRRSTRRASRRATTSSRSSR